MELCTEKLDSNTNYEFKNGAAITFMAYTDDIVLFSKTESGLQQNSRGTISPVWAKDQL